MVSDEEEPDADGNMIPRYTDRYHVVSVEDQEVIQTGGLGYYYINLDKQSSGAVVVGLNGTALVNGKDYNKSGDPKKMSYPS